MFFASVAEAPARGPVRVFMPRQLGKDREGNFVTDRDGNLVRLDVGYQGRKAMQRADAFGVMQVQARKRVFTAGQIEAGYGYAALFERYANAGVRCSSLEVMPSGSGGGGEYIDALFDLGRRLRLIQSRIGGGLAKEIMRSKPGTDARRVITDRQQVDQVCLAGKTISQVLRYYGSINIEALFGRKAWVGLELSSKVDTTAIVIAIPVDGLIYLISFTFLPVDPKGFIQRAQMEKREYFAWRDDGWLEVHTGGSIDEAEIVNRLDWVRQKLDLQEFAYDPWGMKYLADELDKKRFPMVELRQGYASMSNPMKRFEEKIAQNKIRHGGNPVPAWQIGNVNRDEDAAENVKPNKKKSNGRINAAVAAIVGLQSFVANIELTQLP
ncbi:terminase TerL endonuclease subunit [Candidatus Halocynthiibacter alkanivorans]|uniref:terminase TerL endonuclease subunit n=1 Tax=Candidatus Halocynthiibacter alkanivorans TaxID=2267619 RepID=UPI001F38747F|nr:terminase TerL endonuclease subunit [Candidatus Halocynthiibacter alkanivorans]